MSDEEIIKIILSKELKVPSHIKEGGVLLKSLWILKTAKDNTPADAFSCEGISKIAHKILDEDIFPNSISKALSRAGKKIRRHGNGFYEIMRSGREELEKNNKDIIVKNNVANLFKKIKKQDEKEFIEEAINCLKVESGRSTIIMLWCGTLYKIYHKIESKGFNNFNIEYLKRYVNKNNKPSPIKKIDDFEYYPDSEVLLICEDLGIFDRSQRRVLEDCLKLRNMCSHPGKYKPKEHKINSFIEDILENVFN